LLSWIDLLAMGTKWSALIDIPSETRARKICNRLHKRLLDDPNTDIRIGYFWDKNKKKPKSYMFQYKKPDQIFARLDGYIREIYIKDNSINTITDDFKNTSTFLLKITIEERGLQQELKNQVINFYLSK